MNAHAADSASGRQSVSSVIDALCWPIDRLGEAIESLARAASLPCRAVECPVPADLLRKADDLMIGQWIADSADWFGIEAESIVVTYAEIKTFLRTAAPAIIMVASKQPGFLLLAGRRGMKRVKVLAPDRTIHAVPATALEKVLCRWFETPARQSLDRLVQRIHIPGKQAERLLDGILQQRFGSMRLRGFWVLRCSPHGRFLPQARHMKLPRNLALLLGARVLQYAIFLLSWWLIGKGLLGSGLELAWLAAWAFLLLTLVPLSVFASWAGGQVAIDAGTLIQQRLMASCLVLKPEDVRTIGVGQFVGRVIESYSLETLLLRGGLTGVTAVIELLMALVVLGTIGAGPLLLLLGGVAASGLLLWRYGVQRDRWTRIRLEMTHNLIEQMSGHRTRLAQEPRTSWHRREDHLLERYIRCSIPMDRLHALLIAVLARGWLLTNVLVIAAASIRNGISDATLAIGLGGSLLAFRGLRAFVLGATDLIGAGIAWKQLQSFRKDPMQLVPISPIASTYLLELDGQEHASSSTVLLEAQGLSFSYAGRKDAIIQDCDLTVTHGDRILLVGSSGGGKSTLCSMLAGLRSHDAGLLLLRGLDRSTLSMQGWRRRVVIVPQFHENHILTGSFAFNALLGRRWPAYPADLQEAEQVCRELGLGPLIDRMPGGLQQMVGETGWQLSHGERSRLYIARAILHGADLVILDESFGALDPHTFRQCLECVLRRAPALLIITHA